MTVFCGLLFCEPIKLSGVVEHRQSVKGGTLWPVVLALWRGEEVLKRFLLGVGVDEQELMLASSVIQALPEQMVYTVNE